ncbi:MAG: hybrid sensor histidine kinase/response regulator [Pseudanabaena frigida]|uniref:histidine kinase n=1 Tax=Pseudanabaena frigida TaxID=945775 RepID=A0A2W4W706_9CYAN|nr:MAG: hybrid sensor histidine kinase/response regulator [Pseudanabaena frigida]
MRELSILVIDDEPDNFDVIDTLLNEQNYVLHYAADGQEAISLLDVFKPNLILLDVMMPKMDGIEVCKRIKSIPQWQSVPIVMVTALNTKQDLSRCLDAGADDFISKPVNSLELRARVKSMLRIKQQYDQIKTLSNLQESTIVFLQDSIDGLCGNLASTLPHELNTPLNGIVTVIDLLIDDYQNMDKDELYEFLLVAQQSAYRLNKLTKRFLQYSQLEILTSNPKFREIKSTKTSIQILIESAIHSKAEQVNRLDDLLLELPNLEDVEICMSDKDFVCIIEELVENAFKFSQPNTPVKICTQLKDGIFHLSISDRGRGMTEEQIAKVSSFTQFERKYYEQQGIGLGLQIVKKIVELYGGKSSISSIYHQETIVSVEIPSM